MSQPEPHHDPHNDAVYDARPDPHASDLGYPDRNVGVQHHHNAGYGEDDAVMYGAGDGEWIQVPASVVYNLAAWAYYHEAQHLQRRRANR